MTRRDFLRQCAALAGALALPPEVLALPRELAPPGYFAIQYYGGGRRSGKVWTREVLQAYTLQLVAGADEVGQATLRRGSDLLLRVVAGRDSFGRWTAPPDGGILWSPDLRLVVSEGAVAAVPFADRVLFASATEQRWLSTVRLP